METQAGFRLCEVAFQLPFLTPKPAKIVKARETLGGNGSRDSLETVAPQLQLGFSWGDDAWFSKCPVTTKKILKEIQRCSL